MWINMEIVGTGRLWVFVRVLRTEYTYGTVRHR